MVVPAGFIVPAFLELQSALFGRIPLEGQWRRCSTFLSADVGSPPSPGELTRGRSRREPPGGSSRSGPADASILLPDHQKDSYFQLLLDVLLLHE